MKLNVTAGGAIGLLINTTMITGVGGADRVAMIDNVLYLNNDESLPNLARLNVWNMTTDTAATTVQLFQCLKGFDADAFGINIYSTCHDTSNVISIYNTVTNTSSVNINVTQYPAQATIIYLVVAAAPPGTYNLTVQVQDEGNNALTTFTYIRWNTSNIDLVNSTGYAEFSGLSNGTYVLSALWQNSTNNNGVVTVNATDSVNAVISGSDVNVLVELGVYNITVRVSDNSRAALVVDSFSFVAANNASSKTVCSASSSCFFLAGNGTSTPSTILWNTDNVRANATDGFSPTSYNENFDYLARVYSSYDMDTFFNDTVTAFTPSNITLSAPNSTSITITSYTINRVQNGTWTINNIMFWNNNVKPVADPTFSPTGDSQSTSINCRIYNRTVAFDDLDAGDISAGELTSYRLTAPNNTVLSGLSPGTSYNLQNGTSLIDDTVWRAINVTHASNSFDASAGIPNVTLRLKPHTSRGGGYIGLNDTITSNTVNSQTGSNLTFTVNDGGGVGFRIIVEVNSNVTFIEKDNVNITSYSWDGSATIMINTTGLSVFELIWAGANTPINNYIVITNMDDTNYMYSEARYYLFVLNVTDYDGVSDLDFGSIAFSDGVSWMNVTVDLQSMAVTILNGSDLIAVSSVSNSTVGDTYNLTVGIKLDWDVDDENNVDLYVRVNDTGGLQDGWEILAADYVNIETDLYAYSFGISDVWAYPSTNYSMVAEIYYEGSVTTRPPSANFTSGCILQNWDSFNLNISSMSGADCTNGFTSPASAGGYVYYIYLDGAGDYSDGVVGSTTIYVSPASVTGMELNLVLLLIAAMIIFTVLGWWSRDTGQGSKPPENSFVFSIIAFGLAAILTLMIVQTTAIESSGQGFFVSTRLADTYLLVPVFLIFALVNFFRVATLAFAILAWRKNPYVDRDMDEEFT
jgi:hypothetical protein